MDKETYLSIVDRISDDLKGQPDVDGILLFGSLAEGKIAKRSDIDIMVLVDKERPYYRDCKFINGIWVENLDKKE